MSSAAPGVDQAMLTGIRVRSPSTTATAPDARQTASSPDAACRSSAPTARSPARTTGNAPPKPTSAVTTPASTGRITLPVTPRTLGGPARHRPARWGAPGGAGGKSGSLYW